MKSRHVTHYNEIEPFITKDGSVIRELMHPTQHASKKQSLAEARLPVGSKAQLHRHHQAEELYYIVQGEGMMSLDQQQFKVDVGDTVCIKPGQAHCIANVGAEELVLLCCCSPAYSHEDTELIVTEMA